MSNQNSSRQQPIAAGGREHKVFLLRLWRETPLAEWRIAIQQSPQDQRTSQPMGLPSLNELTRFLEDAMQE